MYVQNNQTTAVLYHGWYDTGMGPANGGVVPKALFVSVFLNVFAVGLIIPLLPSLVTSLGGGPAYVGAIGTIYGVAQLVGANILGPLSDSFGRKIVLRISFVGGACGYFLVYVATRWGSLWLLLLSRVPVGLAMQTMTVARAIVSDCSTASDRAAALGRTIGVAAGLGFIVGPMTGGILSTKRPTWPPLLAVCLFAMAYAIAVAYIPETAPLKRLKKRGGGESSSAKATGLTQSRNDGILTSVRQVFWGHVFARKVLVARAFVIIGYLMMQSSFHVFAHQRFGLDPKSIGFVLTYCGGVSVLVDFFFVPFLLKRMGRKNGREEQLVAIVGAVCVGLAMIAMATSRTLRSFLVSLVPLAVGTTLFKRSVMSMLTKCVPPESVGTISGVANAFDSACRILAPAIAGVMMEWIELSSPFIFGAIGCFVGCVLLRFATPGDSALEKTGEKKKHE
eukprot:g2634.t1